MNRQTWTRDKRSAAFYLWHQAWMLLVVYALQIRTQNGEVKDICQWETFMPKCGEDEVVVIKSALYGRMESGRCVKRDYGYIGCVTDVKPLSDQRCSGRRNCEIAIPDRVFDRGTPCPEDLRRYLKISYQCVKVVTTKGHSCKVSDYATLEAPRGYLASIITQETGCGSSDTPWVIKVPKGQTINLTLHDFGLKANLSRHRSHCDVYAILKERERARSVTVCGGQGREVHAYSSATNVLEVRLMGGKDRQFLIYYETVGCADMPPPPEGWVQRKGMSMIVGCTYSTNTWHLTCNQNNWVGQTGNCTLGEPTSTALLSLGSLPHATSITVIVVIALVIGLVVLVVGLVCLRRAYGRRGQEAEGNIMTDLSHKGTAEEGKYAINTHYPRVRAQPLLTYQGEPCKIEENDYAYVEEFQFACSHPPSVFQNTLNRAKEQTALEYGFSGNVATRGPFKLKPLDGTLCRTLRDKQVCDCGDVPQYFVLDPDEANQHTCAGTGTGQPVETSLDGSHVVLYDKGGKGDPIKLVRRK